MKYILPTALIINVLFGISMSSAAVDTLYTHYNLGGSVNISGPADSAQRYGTIIYNSGSRMHSICRNSSLNYNLGRIEYSPLAVWTGATFNSGPAFPLYYLYQSGVTGLDLSPQIRGDAFNGGLPGMNGNIPRFSPMPPQQTVVWTGNIPNINRIASGFSVGTQMYVYKGPERLESATTIAQQPIFRFVCYDRNNVAQETNTFVSSAINVNVNVTSCTPDAKSAIINMEGVPVGKIENANAATLINTKQQTFSLKCDSNIRLSVSVVDLNDPSNNTTTSTLTGDSTAAGVGFTITSPAGARLQFGPDGSAMGIPGQIKYFIGNAGTAFQNNPISHSLGFSYVRKPAETIKTGSAKSLIGITYSYQ